MSDLTRRARQSKVAEAAAKYIAERQEEGMPVATISSKNQITLPAHILREMGLRPGDRLAVSREGNRLTLRPRPRDWVSYHAGGLRGLYGSSREEVDAYLEEIREEGRRDGEIERAWAGQRPAAEE